jgi:hypothetical protein
LLEHVPEVAVRLMVVDGDEQGERPLGHERRASYQQN